ncbi:hypothetical protein ERJ75_000686800 [Trypanosoma vivax]|nr:hypothetical protein ERJ75_000686800 [Trypanosoma vivax]
MLVPASRAFFVSDRVRGRRVASAVDLAAARRPAERLSAERLCEPRGRHATSRSGARSTAAEGASLANGARHGCSDILRAVVARINAARGPSRCREEAGRGRMDARVGSKGRAAGNERRGGTGQRKQVNRKHAAPASRRRVAALRGALHARWEGLGATKGQTAADFLVLCRAKRAADEAVLAATGAAVRVERCRDALGRLRRSTCRTGRGTR